MTDGSTEIDVDAQYASGGENDAGEATLRITALQGDSVGIKLLRQDATVSFRLNEADLNDLTTALAEASETDVDGSAKY